MSWFRSAALWRGLVEAALVGMLLGLGTDSARAQDRPVAARLEPHRFQFHYQTWNNCGPASLTTALSYFGWGYDQHRAARFLKPHVEDKNVSPVEMAAFVNEHQDVLPDLRAFWRYGGTIELITAFIAADLPVVVETGFQPAGEDWMGHYRTVIGYDDHAQVIFALDSYLGPGPGHEGITFRYEDFDAWWRHFNRVFLVIYPQAREREVAAILGAYVDPAYAAEAALVVAQDEAAEWDDRWAWFNAGTSATKLKRYDEAVVYYDEAFRKQLPWRMLWYQFGPFEALYHTGQYEDVIALADTVAVITPHVEETYVWRGLALAAMGHHDQALAEINTALAFNPNNTLALDAYVLLQGEVGQAPA